MLDRQWVTIETPECGTSRRQCEISTESNDGVILRTLWEAKNVERKKGLFAPDNWYMNVMQKKSVLEGIKDHK
jgi:hypothetical protein